MPVAAVCNLAASPWTSNHPGQRRCDLSHGVDNQRRRCPWRYCYRISSMVRPSPPDNFLRHDKSGSRGGFASLASSTKGANNLYMPNPASRLDRQRCSALMEIAYRCLRWPRLTQLCLFVRAPPSLDPHRNITRLIWCSTLPSLHNCRIVLIH